MADTTRKWGIITSVTGLEAGICVNSLDTSENVETGQARNEKGQVTDMCGFSRTRSITVTGVLDTAKGELAKAGAKLTIGGKDYLITSVQKKESNTTFVEVTLTCEGSDEAIITVIDSSTNPAP